MGKKRHVVKSSRQEIDLRHSDIMEQLLNGRRSKDIIRNICDQYGITKKTVQRDITLCYGAIRKRFERNTDDLIAEHIAKYEHIHKKALEAYDFKAAITALQSIEKLLKLHKDEPLVAIQQNNMNLSNLTMDELLKLLEKSNG